MERSARKRKSPKSIEQLKSKINSENPTETGITGQPIPKKKRSPAKQHEFEKKRRENLGRNVGGVTYNNDVNPYTNPRQRTFEEFMQIAEAMSETEINEKFSLAADPSKPQSPKPTVLARTRLVKNTERGWNSNTKGEPLTQRSRRVVGTRRREDSETGVREETDVAQPPATKAERDRIKKMQQLARLMKRSRESIHTSDVAKEEYEIDEEQLDEIMKFQQKRDAIERRKKMRGYEPPTKGPHAERTAPTRLRSGSLPPERN